MHKTHWRYVSFTGATPPWELVLTAERGCIAIATRAFEAGECICREMPMFSVPSHCASETQLERAMQGLDQEDLDAYFALSNTCPDATTSVAMGVFTTNAFDMADSDEGAEVSGLYCAIARLNHSCSPNVQQTHYPDTREEALHAARFIGKGEELCDCYIHLLQSRERRRAELQSLYGFHCECAACSLPPALQIEDDKLRERADALDNHVLLAAAESVPDAVYAAQTLLKLLETESSGRGWGERFLAGAHATLHALLMELGERDSRHLRLALKHNDLVEGVGSAQSKRYRALLAAS